MASSYRDKQIEERGVIVILVKDQHIAVPAIPDMIRVPNDVSARNPRHGKTKVPLPLEHCKIGVKSPSGTIPLGSR